MEWTYNENNVRKINIYMTIMEGQIYACFVVRNIYTTVRIWFLKFRLRGIIFSSWTHTWINEQTQRSAGRRGVKSIEYVLDSNPRSPRTESELVDHISPSWTFWTITHICLQGIFIFLKCSSRHIAYCKY